jgi:hypothetical protein
VFKSIFVVTPKKDDRASLARFMRSVWQRLICYHPVGGPPDADAAYADTHKLIGNRLVEHFFVVRMCFARKESCCLGVQDADLAHFAFRASAAARSFSLMPKPPPFDRPCS